MRLRRRDEYAALPVRQKVFGAEHPETLNAHASLASWTGQADPRERLPPTAKSEQVNAQ
jgi:hypothetical protein